MLWSRAAAWSARHRHRPPAKTTVRTSSAPPLPRGVPAATWSLRLVRAGAAPLHTVRTKLSRTARASEHTLSQHTHNYTHRDMVTHLEHRVPPLPHDRLAAASDPHSPAPSPRATPARKAPSSVYCHTPAILARILGMRPCGRAALYFIRPTDRLVLVSVANPTMRPPHHHQKASPTSGHGL